MPHEYIEQSKLPHRELEGLVASPHPDGLSIKEKLADDRQMMKRAPCPIRKFIHNAVGLCFRPRKAILRLHSRPWTPPRTVAPRINPMWRYAPGPREIARP